MAQPAADTGATDRAHAAGMEQGIILQRLREHDKHFNKINGSMGKLAEEMGGLRLAVQELSLQARADGVSRLTTATALKDAAEERRQRSASAWTPLTRTVAIMGGLLTAIALVSFVAAL